MTSMNNRLKTINAENGSNITLLLFFLIVKGSSRSTNELEQGTEKKTPNIAGTSTNALR